jgi:nucleoside-diphosphate-sugar epimerase
MHKIMLLGGGGFIGNALARTLVKAGNAVLVLNRTGGSMVPDVRVSVVDRSRPDEVLAAAKRFGADIVIDMIAFEEADTLALLDRLAGRIGRYVLISSCDVYAAFGRLLGTEAGPVDNTPLEEGAILRSSLYPFRGLMEGRELYDKIPLEHAALAQTGLQTVVLRLPMVFGPDDPRRRFKALCQTLLDGQSTFALDEKQAQWKSPFLHVDDVASAIALAACHARTSGGTFNIGPDVHLSEKERSLAFAGAIGKTITFDIKPTQNRDSGQNYDQHLVLCSDRLRQSIGWSPMLSQEAAYQSVWAWEKRQAA